MSLVSHCQLKSLWSAHHLAAALQEAATKSTASDGECGSANGRHATKSAGCAAGAADSCSLGSSRAASSVTLRLCATHRAGRDCRNAVEYEHTESVSAEAFHIFSTLQGSQLIGLWFSSPVWLIYTDAISLWIGLLTSTLIQQQAAVVGYYFPFFTLPYFAKLVYS